MRGERWKMIRVFHPSNRKEGAPPVTRGGLCRMGLGEESRSWVWEMLSWRSLLDIQRRLVLAGCEYFVYLPCLGEELAPQIYWLKEGTRKLIQLLSEMSIRCSCFVLYIGLCVHTRLCQKRYRYQNINSVYMGCDFNLISSSF